MSTEQGRIFGRATLRALAAAERAVFGGRGHGGRGRGSARKTLLVKPRDQWPPLTGTGLGMETCADGSFAFTQSAAYRLTQLEVDAAVNTADPNVLQRLLGAYPYQLDALLRLSDYCSRTGQHERSAELVERALYACEGALHPLCRLATGARACAGRWRRTARSSTRAEAPRLRPARGAAARAPRSSSAACSPRSIRPPTRCTRCSTSTTSRSALPARRRPDAPRRAPRPLAAALPLVRLLDGARAARPRPRRRRRRPARPRAAALPRRARRAHRRGAIAPAGAQWEAWQAELARARASPKPARRWRRCCGCGAGATPSSGSATARRAGSRSAGGAARRAPAAAAPTAVGLAPPAARRLRRRRRRRVRRRRGAPRRVRRRRPRGLLGRAARADARRRRAAAAAARRRSEQAGGGAWRNEEAAAEAAARRAQMGRLVVPRDEWEVLEEDTGSGIARFFKSLLPWVVVEKRRRD